LRKIKDEVSDIVDDEYLDMVSLFKLDIQSGLYRKLGEYFKESKKDVDDAEGSETKSYEVSDSKWYNPFSWGRTKTKYETYTTVRTGAVENSLERLTCDIEDTIESYIISYIKEWKKKLSREILAVLRENISDYDLNPKQIKIVLGKTIREIELPDIYYSGKIPSSLKARGTLKGSEAESFIAEAQNYINSLYNRVRDDMKNYLEKLTISLENIEMSKNLFGKYDEYLKELSEQIENKEIILERFNMLKEEIRKVA
jgi:hypothetical protein